MTFARYLQVFASAQILIPPAPPINIINSDGLGLTMEWSVTKTVGVEPDTCELTIYNLGLPNRELLEALTVSTPVVAPRLIFSIGWENIPYLIFNGQIDKVRPNIIERTDVITSITAVDGLSQVRDSPSSFASLGAEDLGVAIQLAVAKVIGDMKLVPGPGVLDVITAKATEVDPSGIALLRTYTFTDDPKDLMTGLMETLGLQWGVKNGFVVLFEGGVDLTASPVEIGTTSGLLNWDVSDDGVLTFEALARPDAQAGGPLVLTDPQAASVTGGTVRISTLQFTGSTRGDSRMTGTARRLVAFGA